ncbi:MAG: hypothetical protein PHC50_06150 [Candidatus Cloacimonetes bacterium]|nr:hypothetical protein [Candidatus Cloacimonadota bacterium]
MDNSKFVIKLEFKGKEELQQLIAQIGKQYNIPVDIDISTAKLGVFKEFEDRFRSLFESARQFSSQIGFAIQGIKQMYGVLDKVFGTVIRTSSEFEQLRLRLFNLYQDTDRASAAFEKFRKVALETPATLREVVGAGANLKAFGLDAENVLESVQDLAAFMGIDIVEAANAVGRAFAGGAGAAIMLRDRGILELIRSFHGIDDLSKLTLPEFREAMLSTFKSTETGIAGSSARMADSYAGAMAQMQDAMETLFAAIGDVLTPAIADFARAITPLIEKAAEFSTTQAAITVGLIVANALVVKQTLAVMADRAAWAALTIEQQKQIMTMMVLAGAQKTATISTITFSVAMKGLGAAFVAARTAVQSFVASIPVIGWVIIGVTAAFVGLNALFKKNTKEIRNNIAVQKDLLESTNKDLQQKKETAQVTVELAEKYEELTLKAKRSSDENKELERVHNALQKRYPGIISSTGTYAEKLDAVRKMAGDARGKIHSLTKEIHKNNIEMARLDVQDKRVNAYEELAKEFTWYDYFMKGARGTALKAIKGYKDELLSTAEMSAERLRSLAAGMESLGNNTEAFYRAERASLLKTASLLKQAAQQKEKIASMQAFGPEKDNDSGSGDKEPPGKEPPLSEVEKMLREYEALKKARFDLREKEIAEVSAKIDKEIALYEKGSKKRNALEELKAHEIKKINQEHDKRIEKDKAAHYDKLKFFDSEYYQWKREQIETEAEAMNMPKADKERWVFDQTKALDEAQYDAVMSRMNQLRDLGLVTYSDIAKKAEEYYRKLEDILWADGELTEEEKELLAIYKKRYQEALLAVNRDSDIAKYYNEIKFLDKGYFEWKKARLREDVDALDILPAQKVALFKARLKELEKEFEGFQGDKTLYGKIMDGVGLPKEQHSKVKGAFQEMANSITGIFSQMYNNLGLQRDRALVDLEKRAKNERKTDAWLAKEKERINEEYEKKQRTLKRTEQKMQIASATVNTLEGITNALTIKPAWLAPILAASVGALGFAQVKMIAEQKFASGGLFRGKGSTTSDSNIIAVSDNEYIVSADRVKRFGVGFFDALNFGGAEQIRKALNSIKMPTFAPVPAPVKTSGYAAGGQVPTVSSKPANIQMNITLKCDGKELARAVARGNKKIIST